MFAKTIIDSDAFLDMPLSAHALYFHLSMRADDDGFINNPKKIQRMIGASDDDLKLLIAKRFIIPFESGIVVIKHCKIHNYNRNDRYKPTVYEDEKSLLQVKENGVYTVGIPSDNQVTYQMDTQDRLGKDRLELGKDSIEKDIPATDINVGSKRPSKRKHGEYKHVLLTAEEKEKLYTEYGQWLTDNSITFLDEYIEMKGYKAKSHYLAIRKWVVDAVKERDRKKNNNGNQGSSRYDWIDNIEMPEGWD